MNLKSMTLPELSALLKENAVGFDLSGGKCVFNRL